MAGRRDFDTDEAAYLRDVGKYCDTVLLRRADESDNGEFFPDIIRQFADLGLLESMFDEQRNLQLHRMRLVHQTTELVAVAFPAAVVALGALRLQAYLLKRYAEPDIADRYLQSYSAPTRPCGTPSKRSKSSVPWASTTAAASNDCFETARPFKSSMGPAKSTP